MCIRDRYFFSLKSALEKGKGRFVDGLADPLIAVLSDNCRARPGRRKVFLLASGLPLALTPVLLFFPPFPGGESAGNGLWLGLLLSLFYIAFTAYVNPYLAAMAELCLLYTSRDLRIGRSPADDCRYGGTKPLS